MMVNMAFWCGEAYHAETWARLSPTQDAIDLTDAHWAAIAPIATTSPKGDHPTGIDQRAISEQCDCNPSSSIHDIPGFQLIIAVLTEVEPGGRCWTLTESHAPRGDRNEFRSTRRQRRAPCATRRI